MILPTEVSRRSMIFATAGATVFGTTAPGEADQVSTKSTVRPAREVMWAANVRSKPFIERVDAAARAGFTHISVFPIDWRGWKAAGLTAASMRKTLSDAGIRVLTMDPFVQWVPDFAIPEGYPADYVGFIDFPEDQILQAAEELEAEAINCVEGLGQPYGQAQLIDAFGAFADRAQERGLRVTLEFMPISSIPDLAAGWAIVKSANRANAGLCFDTWHYFRSQSDEALLREIPGSRIFEVQLADALLALQAPTLTEDLLRFRRLPGEGEMDIAGVCAVLQEIGAWSSVGPEVFADAMDALTANEAGKRCRASTDQFLNI
jgi:sugar phosphate isomerase/epimerase